MGGLLVQIPSGALALYKLYSNPCPPFKIHGHRPPRVLETKESQQEFEFLVKEACILAGTRFILENEVDDYEFSLLDQLQLQTYDFADYVRSCKFIEFDSCPGQLLKGNLLDLKSFPALDQKRFVELFGFFPGLPPEISMGSRKMFDAQNQGKFVEVLKRHMNELKELEFIDELYAYRKSLATCEFIECESDFDGVFNRLKNEEKWTVSDDVLKIALQQHFSLLKSDTEAKKDTIPHKPIELLSGDIQKAVDCEHRVRKQECVKKLLESRLEHYHQRMEFKRLFTQDFIEIDAWGFEHVLKSVSLTNQWTQTLLPKIKDAVTLLYGGVEEGSGTRKEVDLSRQGEEERWGEMMLTDMNVNTYLFKNIRLKVRIEEEYYCKSNKKRVKSAQKMVHDALEEVDWSIVYKHLPSQSTPARRGFYDFRGSTPSLLGSVCDVSNWALRTFFYMYNHYIYTRPPTARQPVNQTLKLVQRRMPKIASMGQFRTSVDGIAHQRIPKIAGMGGCQTVGDFLKLAPQRLKIAGTGSVAACLFISYAVSFPN